MRDGSAERQPQKTRERRVTKQSSKKREMPEHTAEQPKSRGGLFGRLRTERSVVSEPPYDRKRQVSEGSVE